MAKVVSIFIIIALLGFSTTYIVLVILLFLFSKAQNVTSSHTWKYVWWYSSRFHGK